MTLTISNIEKEVLKATKKMGTSLTFDISYDCGNAYVNVIGSLNAITTVVFNDNGEFETAYTIQYKEEVLDENEDSTGEFEEVENELYMGNSLKTALNKLRLVA